MFKYCENFNQPIEIPNTVMDCRSMFEDCKSFNQPLAIPDNVKEYQHMLTGYKSFDQHLGAYNTFEHRKILFCANSNFKIFYEETAYF